MLHEEIISNVLLYINHKTKWYSYTNNYIIIVLIAMDEHIKWRERESFYSAIYVEKLLYKPLLVHYCLPSRITSNIWLIVIDIKFGCQMPAKDRRHSSFWNLYFDLGIACIFCVININNNKGMSVEPFVVCVFYKDNSTSVTITHCEWNTSAQSELRPSSFHQTQ